MEEGKKAAEIMAINVDMTCDRDCKACEKFFDCELEEKWKVLERGRMLRAKMRMGKIKHKIVVVGGKGGVGKSMLAANMAMALAMKGNRVSILDHDFDGPCIPKMFGVVGKGLRIDEDGIQPVEGLMGVQVISTGLFLKDEQVLTWLHEMRRSATEEFLTHVNYGERDWLVVDLPPGTSSDAVNSMLYIPGVDGAVVVTIPPRVSQIVAKKATLLCQTAKVRVLGIIENMSGLLCPKCGKRHDIFRVGGGEVLSQETGVPFLGRVPIDPKLSYSSDVGEPFVYKYPESAASKSVMEIVERIERAVENG